jgi:uncharacterized RDD family membrane protein YckC
MRRGRGDKERPTPRPTKTTMQFHPKDLSELDELTEEHLGFSALSEGLGFARQSKTAPTRSQEGFNQLSPAARDAELQRKAFSGIGAVAAGPARPATSIPSVVAPPTQSRSVAPPAPSRTMATPVSAVRTAPAAGNVLAEPAAERSVRVAAFALDIAILLVPMACAWWISFHSRAWAIFRADMRPPLALFALIVAVYFLISESFGGQSLGKMALGLRVVEDDKYQKPTGLPHAAKRLALLAFGTLFAGLGLLSSFWDAKRRPWHDRYSGSIVRRK